MRGFLLLFLPSLDFSAFFIAMITMERTIIAETSSVIVNDWAGNSGVAGDEEEVGSVSVPVRITETVPSSKFVTYTYSPLGATATP